MKHSRWIVVSLAMAAVGSFVCWEFRPQPRPIIEGRPLVDWLREVEFEGSQEKRAANEVLYAAGLRIIPELSHLLLQRDSTLIARAPVAWIPERMRVRYNDQMKLKANAAWVISVIAHRDPGCTEVRGAVPSLIGGLSSRSAEVRYLSSQGLAAIGVSASNAVPALLLQTADESSSVRLCAIEALGRIGSLPTESLRVVRAALSDTNNDVRFVATQVLARLEKKPNGNPPKSLNQPP